MRGCVITNSLFPRPKGTYKKRGNCSLASLHHFLKDMFPLENIITNPGLEHIGTQIFQHLDASSMSNASLASTSIRTFIITNQKLKRIWWSKQKLSLEEKDILLFEIEHCYIGKKLEPDAKLIQMFKTIEAHKSMLKMIIWVQTMDKLFISKMYSILFDE